MEALTLGIKDPAMVYEHRYCVGLDLGQSHDPTAVCVVERISGFRWTTWKAEKKEHFRSLFHVRHLERLPLGISYPQQITYVASLLRREPLAAADPGVFIDYTGVGRPVFDMFKQAGVPRLCGVNITSGLTAEPTAVGWSVPKTLLVSGVQAKLHSGDLRIAKELPEAPVLLRELQDFRARFTVNGNATFGAREGAHDDLVLALALAVYGVGNERRVYQAPLMTRR
jgi:hypothetical protein